MRLADVAPGLLATALLTIGSARADEPRYGKVETFEPGKKYTCVPSADRKGWNCSEGQPAKTPGDKHGGGASAAETKPPAPDAATHAAEPIPAPPPSAPATPGRKGGSLPSYLRAPGQPVPTAAAAAPAEPPTPAAPTAVAAPEHAAPATRVPEPAVPPKAPEPPAAPMPPVDSVPPARQADAPPAPASTPPKPVRAPEPKPAEPANAPASPPVAPVGHAPAAPEATAPAAREPVAPAQATVETPLPAAPAAARAEPPATATQAPPAPEPAPLVQETTQPVPASPPPAAMAGPEPARAAAPPSGVRGNREFLSLPASDYVIELAHAASATEFSALRESLSLAHGDLYELRLRRDGGDWWLLVWASFGSVDAARAARAELPADAAINAGWPRRIGALQAEARHVSSNQD